jgi:YVTN family beta-propeller protein
MKKFKFSSIFLTVLCSLLPAPLYCQWLEETIPVGDNPRPLVYNSTDNKVYCANLYSNNVTVIDGETDSVITTITVGIQPYALVYNSTNNKVYCANQSSNNVTVIDGTSDSVIATITVGGWPYALFYNSMNKKVYCANSTSDNVTIIDGASDSVITTIMVGGGPSAFAWNPIQNRTYVANYWSFTVSVIRDSIISGIEETTNPNTIALMQEIYPNPAKGVIRVRVPLSVKEIKIFDVSGKLIKEIASPPKADRNDSETRIVLKGINPGIYFLRLGKDTKKFIVTR